jgi:hypothetical protein
MKAKHFNRFILPSVSILACAAITVLACGGGDWDSSEGSMFTPHIINQKQSVAFFRTMETPFYDGYDDERRYAFNDQNNRDWAAFFDNTVTEKTINYWLYKASLKQIDSMIFDIKGKPANLTTESKSNSLKTLLAGKATSFLYYTGFAKRNETFTAPYVEYSWEPKAAPVSDILITKQIIGGLSFYTKATEPFMKERYAFQLERLYFFNKEYDKTISFYNENESSFKAGSSLQWRALGYKAAALYKQKKYAESNLLYAMIYDRYAPMKKSAYLSFHPMQKTEWEQGLALAKSTHEKEVLWQLKGLYGNEVEAMRAILKLNPSSELADLLLVRAVNIEEWNMESESYEAKKTGKVYSVNKTLLAFLNETSATIQSPNAAAWHLSAAYLNYMQGDYAQAEMQMKRAEKFNAASPMNKAQYHLIAVYGNLKKTPAMNEKLEAAMLNDLKILFSKETAELDNFRSYKAKAWTRRTLAELYLKKGEVEKAELIFSGIDPKQFESTDDIKKMIAYYEKQNPSAFEKLFFEQATLFKTDYQELLGIRYAQQDKLEDALAALKAIDSKETLYGNPFTIHIKDCHDCDHEAAQKTKYTKAAFIEKMIGMKSMAVSKPAEAAQNYFLVANGFYNMTYFGNARLFYDNRVDNTIYTYEHSVTPEENNDLALKYYLLALQNSTDKEFKAKCTFMAAKCEQNAFFMNTPANFKGDFKSGMYFASLKKDYSATKYYQDIIKECGYFKTYLGSR